MRPADLLGGRLLLRNPAWPILLTAVVGDLRPHFIAKGRVGRSYRAIARNGRVLLASDLPLEELVGRMVRVRLQEWRRSILPDDVPEPYGLLLCLRSQAESAAAPLCAQLTATASPDAELVLDVGGRLKLEFCVRQLNTSPKR
jgi:hypothetical protein